MIREVRKEEIPECVQVIRRSHQTVADEFGFTEKNAPRYVALSVLRRRSAEPHLTAASPVWYYWGQLLAKTSIPIERGDIGGTD